jgi:hypothetical protein
MQIRKDIRESLAAKLDNTQLAMAGERIGRQFDEEIDKATLLSADPGGPSKEHDTKDLTSTEGGN